MSLARPRHRGWIPAAALLLWPAVASADDTHYQDYVVGGRAVVLGGAFASISDDPSGVYYNPAGLADVKHSNLQVNGSLYGYERGSIDERLGFLGVPGVETLKLQFTDLIVIPASAGFVKTLGKPARDGLPTHAWGVSVVVPSFRSFSAGTGDGDQIYKRRVTDRELWSGIGYGIKLGGRLRVGVSAYYILRSVTDLEDVTVQQALAGGDKFDSVVNDIALTNGNVVAIVGAKYRLTDELTVGASLRSPSLALHSQAALRFTRVSADPAATGGPVSTFDRLILGDAKSQTAYAPLVRLGASYAPRYRYTLSADLCLHAPTSYTLVEVDEAYKARLPFNAEVERRAVLNFNLGAEVLVVREVSVAVGLFSDFSSAPTIPKAPLADQPPRVHLLGLSMALGYFGDHSLSRLGFVYSFGSGYDVIPQSNIERVLEQEQAFQRVEYSQSFFYVFLSSTFRY